MNRLWLAARLFCRGARGIGVARLFRATINSWHGLIACARSEEAFRQELALLVIGVPLAFFITGDTGERFALIGVLVFLLIVELLNTAIETLSDRVTRDQDPLIKRVKDMGSAAIFLSLLAAGATWLWVLAEKFWQ
jgi:diacylglycerol kinase (ATP)